MKELSKLIFLIKKDFNLFFRTSLAKIIGFAFVLVVLATFCFGQLILVDIDKQILSISAIWLCFIFITLQVLTSSVQLEKGAIRTILLSNVSLSTYFFSKVISISFILCLLFIFISFFFEIFFNFNFLSNIISYLFIVFFTSLGLCGVGILFSMLSLKMQDLEVSLPVVLFPLYIPITIIGIELSRNVVLGQSFDFFWLVSILTVNTICLTLSWCLFEKALRS